MSFRLAVAVLGALVTGGVIAAPALDALSAAPSESAVPTATPILVAVAAPEAPLAKPEVQAPTPAADSEPTEPQPPAPPEPEPAPAELVVIPPTEVNEETVWMAPPEVIPDCDARLEAAGIDFAPSRLPVHKTR